MAIHSVLLPQAPGKISADNRVILSSSPYHFQWGPTCVQGTLGTHCSSLSNKAWFYSSPLSKDPTQLFSTFAFFLWPLPNSSSKPTLLKIYLSVSPVSQTQQVQDWVHHLLFLPLPVQSAITPLSLFPWKTLAPKLDCSIFSESFNPLNPIKSFFWLYLLQILFYQLLSTMSTSIVWACPLIPNL